jgi:hypothetical protein
MRTSLDLKIVLHHPPLSVDAACSFCCQSEFLCRQQRFSTSSLALTDDVCGKDNARWPLSIICHLCQPSADEKDPPSPPPPWCQQPTSPNNSQRIEGKSLTSRDTPAGDDSSSSKHLLLCRNHLFHKNNQYCANRCSRIADGDVSEVALKFGGRTLLGG